MEIKKNLKALDIKISKLANELGVSRPTLDAYIEYYDNGQLIPNEGYQRIFEYLFSGDDMNSVEFAQKYDYVKRVMLSDAKAGAEKNIHDTRTLKLINNIKSNLDSELIDEHLIEFINLIVNNRENELVKSIYMYFNYANGFANINETDIDEKGKSILSQLSKCFAEYNNGSILFDEYYYNQLVEKNSNLVEKKTIKVKDSDTVEYIQSKLNQSENIDINELKKMIEAREEK